MSGGWVAAIGMLAGLLRPGRRAGRGQQVATSLLGAGMLLQSGVFQRDGEVVPGPSSTAQQTGLRPRLPDLRVRRRRWLALVLPDARGVAARDGRPCARRRRGLPAAYAPLRGGADDAVAREAEAALEAAFVDRAGRRVGRRAARPRRCSSSPIEPLDRDGFRRGILDDPVNRELGRVVAYETADWGHFEQIGPLLRYRPVDGRRAHA